MNKHPYSSVSGVLQWGALQIAAVYLIAGSAWILFSDQVAVRMAPNEEMLATISLYKGWGYVFITALLLYWLIRRHTARLHANERQLQKVLDAMPALISYVDSDRYIQYANEAYREWFGEKAEGKHMQQALGEAAYQNLSAYVDRVLTGETTDFETEVPDRNGEERYLNATYIPDVAANGHPRGFFVLVQDMTERKQAEEELRLWADAFEGCAHGIAIDDPNTNRIVVCNPAFAKMHQSRVEEITGSAILSLYSPSDHEHVRHHVEKADQIGHTSFEARMIRTDRSTFPVQMDMVSIFGEDGEVLHRVVTLQDITERRQAEENLRRFELISQHSRDIILFMGYKDGRILEANAAALQAYGYSRDELLALTIRDLRAPDTQNLTADQMAQADAGGILFETIHRRKDGSTFPVEVSSQGATIAGVRTLISIIRDITERRQSQEALRLKDQLLRLTSEMAKVGGWEFDPSTGKGTWTDEVARIHDLDPEQETNLEIGLSFYEGESRRKVEQAVNDAVELARPYDLELEMLTAKGIRKWVRTMALPIVQDGKVVKVQGIFQDITERKQIEKALQVAHDELEHKVQERTAALSEANALLQALMDNMPDHIYFKDRQGRFIRNSRSQARLLGLTDPAEAVGKTDFDFFPHAARSFAEEQEVMRSGAALMDEEEWVVWPDGRETWVLTTKLPLRDSQGQTIGIFGISRDITERKRNEQAIRQLNADLEKQASLLQAANKELEAFSYSVSHDLRAPLRAIDGYTRILVEDYEPLLDDEGKRICGVISREARRMGQLIDDLLAFSRLGRRDMYSSRMDMKALVISVLNEILKEEDRQRIHFKIARLAPVRADSSLMRQVWVNLLSNAIKFTSKTAGAVIEVGCKSTRDEYIYFVRDNGAGFDMEYANKLFGVFQRLHSESEFEGTGVGLAIVQRVIRRHGGRVWAEGEVQKGATLYFSLPRKENLS